MKRRYTVLFALSLVAMVGWSWYASTGGRSVWSMIDAGLFGLIMAAAVSGLATITATNKRSPLFWILLGAVLGAGHVPSEYGFQFTDEFQLVNSVAHGPASLLILGGSVATFLAAFVIVLMPPPAEKQDVAAARVVE